MEAIGAANQEEREFNIELFGFVKPLIKDLLDQFKRFPLRVDKRKRITIENFDLEGITKIFTQPRQDICNFEVAIRCTPRYNVNHGGEIMLTIFCAKGLIFDFRVRGLPRDLDYERNRLAKHFFDR